MISNEFGFPQQSLFIRGVLLLHFLHLGGKILVLGYLLCGSGHEEYVGDGYFYLLLLFLVVLNNIDILGEACCITVVADYLEGEVNNAKHVETFAMQ